MPYTFKLSQIVGAAALTLSVGVYAGSYGPDFSKQTAIDDAYVQHWIQQQLDKPKYKLALKIVEDAELTITAERRTPFRDELLGKTKVIGDVMPEINPVLKRTQATGTAIVVFDVTGSGRATHVSIIVSNPNQELGRDLAFAIGNTLYSPMVEGTTGITRVGMTVGIVWEIDDGKKRKCGVLPISQKLATLCEYAPHSMKRSSVFDN